MYIHYEVQESESEQQEKQELESDLPYNDYQYFNHS